MQGKFVLVYSVRGVLGMINLHGIKANFMTYSTVNVMSKQQEVRLKNQALKQFSPKQGTSQYILHMSHHLVKIKGLVCEKY